MTWLLTFEPDDARLAILNNDLIKRLTDIPQKHDVPETRKKIWDLSRATLQELLTYRRESSVICHLSELRYNVQTT